MHDMYNTGSQDEAVTGGYHVPYQSEKEQANTSYLAMNKRLELL